MKPEWRDLDGRWKRGEITSREYLALERERDEAGFSDGDRTTRFIIGFAMIVGLIVVIGINIAEAIR